ncbi:MAG: toll/interleukin-1 receptor domain-containing protein [Bacteroidia bacterium]|nr:toll/interleukin-1 receptor domain-containing protein [Bacteroidia bacterium]
MPSPTKYDVFLCHNEDDAAIVTRIAEYLDSEGENKYKIKVWLKAWEAIPGTPMLDQFVDAIRNSGTTAVFFGPNSRNPMQISLVRAAIMRQINQPDFRVIPVFLPGAPTKNKVRDKLLKVQNPTEKLLEEARDVANSFLEGNVEIDFRNLISPGDQLNTDLLWLFECGIKNIKPGRGRNFAFTGEIKPEKNAPSLPPDLQPDLPAEPLRDALFRLNYKDQMRTFQKEAAPNVGAYFIFGDEYHCQDLLFNRIISTRKLNLLANHLCIPLQIGSPEFGLDLDLIWYQLGKALGMETEETDPARILADLRDTFQSHRDVVLKFSQIQKIPKNMREQFFFQLLDPFLSLKVDENNPFRLLLFFLSEDAQFMDGWQPVIPLEAGRGLISLPPIPIFSVDIVEDWIEQHADFLPVQFTADYQASAKEIIQKSYTGLPDFVFNEICKKYYNPLEGNKFWNNLKMTLK